MNILLLSIIAKSSSTAMLLTTFIPGGGQFYTHRYFKGVLIGGAQSYILYQGIRTQLDLMDVTEQLDESFSDSLYQRKKDLIQNRREIAWWGALVWTLGVLDSYVDAKLYNFESGISINSRGDPEIELTWRFN